MLRDVTSHLLVAFCVQENLSKRENGTTVKHVISQRINQSSRCKSDLFGRKRRMFVPADER